LDDETYVPVPIYIGEKLVSLEDESESNKKLLKQYKIEKEMTATLESANLLELKKILIDSIQ
jgi:hypothetical protein